MPAAAPQRDEAALKAGHTQGARQKAAHSRCSTRDSLILSTVWQKRKMQREVQYGDDSHGPRSDFIDDGIRTECDGSMCRLRHAECNDCTLVVCMRYVSEVGKIGGAALRDVLVLRQQERQQ